MGKRPQDGGVTVGPRFPVSAESVREELARILASGPFLNAQRPSQFLCFIVERTLLGEEDPIKEYLIGVEVFKRSQDYDPKDDPVVRIEAGRLRKKLAEYYGGPGRDDAVIIELPKGGYIPLFRARTQDVVRKIRTTESIEAASRKRNALLRMVAVALILLVAGALTFTFYLRRRIRSTPTSIAVLPFMKLTAGSEGEYLSDGVSEDLTTSLAAIKGLRVVAATSASQFRSNSEDVRKIGQALNAQALLEGSIAQSGSGLRINAQLIDARNGYHLWAKAYDVSAADLLASEEDIVLETARVLRVPVNQIPPIKRDTENAEAHDLYLRGRYLWSKRDLPDMQESERLFQRAVEEDSNYALAYSGLADAYTVMAINQQMLPAEAIPRARAALQHALELDPNLAQAHATLGLLKSQCEWDWPGGEKEFRKAIELQPNYAEAHHWAGLNYMLMGQFAAAEAELRQAQVLDPLSFMITEGLAENFFFSRRYEEAIAAAQKIPDRRIGWPCVASAYIFKGSYDEWQRAIPEGVGPNDPNRLRFRAEALALSGHRTRALEIMEEVERDRQDSNGSAVYVSAANLGMTYAMIGEKERAFTWLDKAYQQHDPILVQLKVDPGFDSLRSDPRYLDLLRKVGLN